MADLCPICGAEVTPGPWAHVQAGWLLCCIHKLYLKPVRFDSRCDSCFGGIPQGTPAYLCKHGARWVVLHAKTRCVSPPPPPLGPYVKLHLTDDAPWEVVQAAYKALAFLHHPDRGGSTTRMQQINSALDRIRALKGR